ncbi:serine hydrolase [Corynebacterium sp.]|uniref:serine hydrolase domain-containing protein n=1 Tax=Corynebacterium sp. TaxID=1720 RepID=UPI0026DD3846|nr:serine hydrolase domain-containing protein [Corynebacterium sp.]MDO5032862.1 serine hydrolase domain-containing protein [Corynebacterium sp.]
MSHAAHNHTAHNTEPVRRRPLTLVLAILVALILAGALILIGPKPITLSTQRTGDADLAGAIDKHAQRGFRNVTAFTLNGDETTFAGLGADAHTEVEIGSVTKMFTAELLHQEVAAGRLSLDTTVGEVLDVGDTPIATVSLRELRDHTSGLPRLASTNALSNITDMITGANPYEGESVHDIMEAATDAELSGRGEESYSNLGYALLGHVLETEAGVPYEQLLRERIFHPAGMSETYLMTPGSVPADAPRGIMASGRAAQPWEMEGSAPAGAIRSTAADMSKFAQWMMSNGDVTYGWEVNAPEDGGGYWHDGGTYGYSTMLIIDPDTRHAAFANNDTLMGTESLAHELFKEMS